MKKVKATEAKVFSYIRKHHMLEPGDRVIAGISGGADSVCLLFVLLEWAKEMPLELAVVHVNHGIRREAAEDAAYVKELCDRYKIPFYLTEADVQKRARIEKCSEEEAGRRERYEAFAKAAEDFKASKIAVAHNANDRSETLLFHLFRGTGMKGLGSIRPVRDNIIRPLLELERREIEDYLEKRGISYCTDATNASDDYTRNRIRHNILPFAEAEIAQGCVARMARTADMLSETEDYLELQTLTALQECVDEKVCASIYEINVQKLLRHHPVIQKRILHTIVKSLSPGQKDISYVHIMDLLDLFTGTGNRSVELPFGICAKREYEKVSVGIVKEKEESDEYFHAHSKELEMKVFPAQDIHKKATDFPQNEYTKWLDYDKIKGCITLRTRETGDYLTISDGKGGMLHKSLKDYMISRKIPREERDRIPVVAEGNHVLWLVGYRISEYYKISESTQTIMQVQLVEK